MHLIFLLCLLVGAKRYVTVPPEDLKEARVTICKITDDFSAGISEPLDYGGACCFSVAPHHKRHKDDTERAFAHYRDMLSSQGYRVSYETERENRQRASREFCMDKEALKEIREALKCTWIN